MENTNSDCLINPPFEIVEIIHFKSGAETHGGIYSHSTWNLFDSNGKILCDCNNEQMVVDIVRMLNEKLNLQKKESHGSQSGN